MSAGDDRGWSATIAVSVFTPPKPTPAWFTPLNRALRPPPTPPGGGRPISARLPLIVAAAPGRLRPGTTLSTRAIHPQSAPGRSPLSLTCAETSVRSVDAGRRVPIVRSIRTGGARWMRDRSSSPMTTTMLDELLQDRRRGGHRTDPCQAARIAGAVAGGGAGADRHPSGAGRRVLAGLPSRPGVVAVADTRPDGETWEHCVVLGVERTVLLAAGDELLVELLAEVRDAGPGGGRVLGVVGAGRGAGGSVLAAAVAVVAAIDRAPTWYCSTATSGVRGWTSCSAWRTTPACAGTTSPRRPVESRSRRCTGRCRRCSTGRSVAAVAPLAEAGRGRSARSVGAGRRPPGRGGTATSGDGRRDDRRPPGGPAASRWSTCRADPVRPRIARSTTPT